MTDDKAADQASSPTEVQAEPRKLTPAAERALAEAAERRAIIDANAASLTTEKEIAGRGGLEPVRYNDWEIKGIASDF